MAITAVEGLAAAVVFGVPIGLWALANLVAIQLGYLGGVFVRNLLEKIGLAEPGTRINHT
jgi:hypothetical protein